MKKENALHIPRVRGLWFKSARANLSPFVYISSFLFFSKELLCQNFYSFIMSMLCTQLNSKIGFFVCINPRANFWFFTYRIHFPRRRRVYTNEFKNWFLAASAWQQMFALESHLAIQQ